MGSGETGTEQNEQGLLRERLVNWGMAVVIVLLLAISVWLSWLIYAEWQRRGDLRSGLDHLWQQRAALFERFHDVWREKKALKHDPDYQREMLKRRMGYTEEGEQAVVIVEEGEDSDN